MKGTIHALWLLPMALALWSDDPLEDPIALVRQGNAAFHQGAYEVAEGWYTRAEEQVTDPGLVSFNKAAALYRVGQYREAELHYRRCLEDAEGPRKARAHFGLGNCLVQQAAGQDAEQLAAAMQQYQHVLRQAGEDTDLADDACHNLELAKLLWVQALKNPRPKNPPQPHPGEDPIRPPGLQDRPPGGYQLGPGMRDPAFEPGRLEPQPGQDPLLTEQQPSPGRGNLPVVPDQADLVPLSPEDATAHLEQAADRVLSERRQFRQRNIPPPLGGVLDW